MVEDGETISGGSVGMYTLNPVANATKQVPRV